jgi:hypothetical protein
VSILLKTTGGRGAGLKNVSVLLVGQNKTLVSKGACTMTEFVIPEREAISIKAEEDFASITIRQHHEYEQDTHYVSVPINDVDEVVRLLNIAKEEYFAGFEDTHE